MDQTKNPMDGWIKQKTEGMALQDYQLKKLAETVAYVREKSSFYKERFKDFLVPNSFASFENLPLISADDLIREGQRMLCVPQHEIERIVTLFTSGTTGDPKRVYFTEGDQELTVDFFHHGMQCLAGTEDRVMILLPYKTPGSVGDLLHRGLLRIPLASHPYGLIEDYRDAGQYVLENGITCLVGNPVQVLRMAEINRQMGREIKLRSVLLSTDYVPDALAARLSLLWGCRVFEHYGMTEMCFGGGVFCEALSGYHLREADLYFEILSEEGKVLPEGEYGEIAFTTLTRKGMPLVRYKTGDYGRFLKKPCGCGSPLRVMDKVRRRVCGGQNFSIGELDEILFSVPGVTDYNISDEGNATVITVRSIEKGMESADRQVYNQIEALTGKKVRLLFAQEEGAAQETLTKRTIHRERKEENA